ncbi:PqiC family protein [Dyella sp. Tek66A03]|uniref:PqiC family protein n=1 Tax=Dyella sp. Tek66A03 TaxID=3458298 RepID=UPI00403E5CDB
MEHDAALQPRASFLVNVLPVGIPNGLDQSQMVVRQGDSGVAVLETERWVSPLGDEVRGALSSHLAMLLNTRDVAGLSMKSDKPVVMVKVQVRRFDAWPGQRVQLTADWELVLSEDSGHTLVTGTGRFDEGAPGGYPELIRAYQQAVRALAMRIATDAQSAEISRRRF